MNRSNDLQAMVTLDRSVRFSLDEFCRACGARQTVVVEMIEHGIIDPDESHHDAQFHGEALVRAQVAARLMRDLGVNIQGAALAIELLEELDRL